MTMARNGKLSPVKKAPNKKAIAAKHKSAPRSSSKKIYWVVLPENMEGKWFTSEEEADDYVESLKNCVHEMKTYINFGCVETMLRRHNDAFGQKNSEFLWSLKKEAGLV